MIKFENIPKLKDLQETHGLFHLGTVVRENGSSLYLVWNTLASCALLLSNNDLTNPVVYCAVDDYGKPKRNTGLSALIFNVEIIENGPIAFYGVTTGTKLQDLLVYLSAYISLSKEDEETIYDVDPFVDKSYFDRLDNLVKDVLVSMSFMSEQTDSIETL